MSWLAITSAYRHVLHTHDVQSIKEITLSKLRRLIDPRHHGRPFVSSSGSLVGRKCSQRVAIVLAASLCAQACVLGTSDPGPTSGRLVVRWTVNESTDPNQCVMGGADDFDIVITSGSGQLFGEYKAPCTDFETAISDLTPSATFYGDATLVTATNGPRTTTIHVDPFVIHSADLIIDVDFPASSFF